MLLALDACSRESSDRGSPPGGRFTIPPESSVDKEAADAALSNPNFVMDVQSHYLDVPPGQGAFFGQGFPQAACGEDDPGACFAVDKYLEAMFLDSDTTVAVLSAIPAESWRRGPLSIDAMERARGLADRVCGAGRLLLHGSAHPNLGSVQVAMGDMEELVRRHPISAWKVYTHAPGPGWSLDRGVGTAFVQQARALGIPRICVHKGFSGGDPAASPADIGPAAKQHPDVSFIVYHSGYEPGTTEGPYDESSAGRGINRLIASMQRAGIGPNANVFAELGSTWFNAMRNPTEAAHVVGKLLKHVGEDNVLWGTDSIWYGSPQGQIQAFRAFEITAELQERFGYPALTPGRKAKVLGLNAARVYGMDPATVKCEITRDELEQIRSR